MHSYGGLFGEIVTMAVATLRDQKARSGLTILGVVIGIMSIVGSTSLIRGLDQSLRETIESMGPDVIMLTKFSAVSLGSGEEFMELIRRPNLTTADADAIARQADSLANVAIVLGQGAGPVIQERVYHRSDQTKPIMIFGTTSDYPDVQPVDLVEGPFLHAGETRRRTRVAVLGHTPAQPSSRAPIHRETRPHRDQPLHGDRGGRRDAEPRRLQHGAGRLRPRSPHHLSEAVRGQGAADVRGHDAPGGDHGDPPRGRRPPRSPSGTSSA